MMRFLLKEDASELIRRKYKNRYIIETVGLCASYISQIINRRKAVPKNVAYTFTKAINSECEIEDLFDRVK